ncbi:MAG: hypothetical protein AAGJ46_17160 [Planctomycetota bacterium]
MHGPRVATSPPLTGLLAVILGATFALSADAVVVDLDLVLSTPPGSSDNVLDFGATAAGFTDTGQTQFSGTINRQLELELSPDGIRPTGIRFQGGQLSATDFDLRFGFIITLARVQGRNLGGTLTTPSGQFSAVTARRLGPNGSGTFATDPHLLTLNSGTLTGTGLASALAEDLGTSPLGVSQSGTAPLTWGETAANGQQREYQIQLQFPVDATEDISDGSISASVTVEGIVVGAGTFAVTLPQAGDFNGDGVVNASDYTTWRDEFALGQRPLSDFNVWRSNFGAQESAATAAPEPTALAGLLALLSGGAIRCGCRHRTEHTPPR